MQFDHVAVPSSDIAQSVEWYRNRCGATVVYQDSTWALLQVGGARLALVNPQQHPPHTAFAVGEQQLAAVSRELGIPITAHRDGSRGVYLHDPFGNVIELICYPPGQTLYAMRQAP